MQQWAQTRLTAELEAAINAYHSALNEMAADAARGQIVSAGQLQRAAEAGLRLENASTLFELYVGRRRREMSAQRFDPRRAH